MKLYGTENNDCIRKEFGHRLQDIRVAGSLTQKELAANAGVSPRTIERIENGENVKIDNILNVMRALKLLDHLDLVITEQEVSPAVLFQRGKKRKRATSKQKQEEMRTWKWGDEA